MAIDALDADEETEHIVLISKPPAASIVKLVVDRVAKSSKSFTICFLGAQDFALPANARSAPTLKAAAEIGLGRSLSEDQLKPPPMRSDRGKLVRGLFVGGTLCAEAQIVFRQAHLSVASNVPVPGAAPLHGTRGGHVMMDLGHDEFTRGRPHPIIEPAMRDGALTEAVRDLQVGVVLLDIILGYGAHLDPAGHVAGILAARDDGPLVIASVVGTDGDPQPRADQIRTLAEAGVIVAASGADAAEMAIRAIGTCDP
jgi:hypothetical protein